jgi:proline dehydrogenase
VIFATHNAGSVKRSIEQLRDRNLVRNEGDHLVVDDNIRGRVAYAQLLGELTFLCCVNAVMLTSHITAMADSLTAAMSTLFPPSQAGKDAIPINSLYVPYGKIGEVLPYLVRR